MKVSSYISRGDSVAVTVAVQPKRKQLPTQPRRLQRIQLSLWSVVSISIVVGIVACCWEPAESSDVCNGADPHNDGGICIDSSHQRSDKNNNNNSNNSCRLYMAPTTVGGIEGNYGIFTAVDLPTGATVLANDGPSIPVLLDDRRYDPSNAYAIPDTNHLGLFSNVWWGINSRVSDHFLAEFQFGDKEIATLVDLQINFGALPNCHPYKSNLETLQPRIVYDDRTYLSTVGDNNNINNNDNNNHNHHANNPLRGSFSYYTGKHFIVDKPVEAGTELFLDYSGDWERHGFPRTQDYFSAAGLLQKWILAVDQAVHQQDNSNSNNNSNRNPKSGDNDDHPIDMHIDRRRHSDPNGIFPAKEMVDGAKALLQLIQVQSTQDSLFDEDDIVNGLYDLETYTSRILSLVPQTIEDWNKVYDRSWELYIHRISKNLAPKIDDDDDDDDDDDSDDPVSAEEDEDEDTPTHGIPSIQDVADAMYDVSKPRPKSIRDLEETGICLDHIVAGVSRAPLELELYTETETETVTDTPKETDTKSKATMTIGRGAIAARFLAEGQLVVPVPLLHLVDRALFEKVPPNRLEDDASSFEELILNYCFGHSESTLVMCPVTNAVLVNHCSDRNGRFPCGNSGGNSGSGSGSGSNTAKGLGPNAEVRWASDSDWDVKTKDTLKMTLDDLAGGNHMQQHRMMSMEIVAKRDIQEGEEIFIDYGEAWEEAWLEHVRNWSAEDNDVSDSWWSSSLTVFELNQWGVTTMSEEEDNKTREGDDPLFYGDLRDDFPARSHDGRFMATCWYESLFVWSESGLGSRHSWDSDLKEDDGIYWKDLSDDDIYQEYAVDVGEYRSAPFTHFKDHPPGTTGHFWPCSILAKNNREEDEDDDDEDEDRYLVRIYPSDYHHYIDGEEYFEDYDIAEHVLLENYPRSSIRFVTLPYQSDQYHPKAFRHHIEIRDELFPEQWKNKV